MVRHYLLFPDVVFLLAELPVLALLPEELLVLLPDALLLLEVFPVVPLLFEELPALLPVVLFLLAVPELLLLLVLLPELLLLLVLLPELLFLPVVLPELLFLLVVLELLFLPVVLLELLFLLVLPELLFLLVLPELLSLLVVLPELLLLLELLSLSVVLLLELLFLLVVLFLFFVELPELDWVDSVFVLLLELDEELFPPEQAVMENANAPIIPTTKPFLASSLTLNFLFIFFISHLSFSVLILLGETSGVPGSSCCISKDLFSFDDAYYEGESLTDSKRNPNKYKMWPFSLPASLSHCSP